jgi:hypothetical protein
LDEVTVDTEAVGVTAEPGSAVILNNSSVHALHATRGDVRMSGANDLSQPLNLLGVIGLPLILLALVLEFLHLLHQLRRKRASSREYLRRWQALATTPPRSRSEAATACSACGARPGPEADDLAASEGNTCGVCAAA